MQAYSDMLLSEMKSRLTIIAQNDQDWIKKSRSAIVLINSQINQLKTFITKYRFTTQQEEIHFFKDIKPQFAGRLLYFASIHHIVTGLPEGSTKLIRKHYKKELDKVAKFFSSNKDLYQYLRSGHTHFDHQYFTRKKLDKALLFSYPSFDKDPKFTTLHDHTASQIVANKLLKTWLENRILQLSQPQKEPPIANSCSSPLQWTDSKTALVELIYAIHAQGSINGGDAGVKELATFFQAIFNIDLGHYYRTFAAIKTRKTNRGKFLEHLRTQFLKCCDQAADEPPSNS